MWVAGVDGCRGGWIAVLVELETSRIRRAAVHVAHRFVEILEIEPDLQAVAVDIPIGLLDLPQPGGRQCDREARRILGRSRASSVFNPPLRKQLSAMVYGGRQTRGLSRQSFGILPKIRELDEALCQRTLGLVSEAHPELAFALAAGRPMMFNKKRVEGRLERVAVLRKLPTPWGNVLRRVLACGEICYRRSKVGRDDLIDAAILGWTAARIAAGQACSLPAVPPVDGLGRPMAIWY
jgi:predicted RNase H-like nuclease